MTDRSPRPYLQLAAMTRGFAVVVLTASGLVVGDRPAILALASLAFLWSAVLIAERLGVAATLTIAVEAVFVSSCSALALNATSLVLPALALPAFTAAVRRGPRGAVLALATEASVVVAVTVVLYSGVSKSDGAGLLTWMLLSLGLGLIGSFIHVGLAAQLDPLDSYRNAQTLIRQLIGLSGGLNRGLEPVTLAAAIASAVHDELPVLGLVVHVPRGDQLTPIINDHDGKSEQSVEAEGLAGHAFARGVIVVDNQAFALPLSSGAGVVAVVSGFLSPGLDPVSLGLSHTLGRLAVQLEAATVHLDTALLFAAFRDAATVEERRRLAREMHDGVAQEMASLGYLVDDMMASATSPEHALRLQVLRERLSAVVGEVRQSVRTLRTAVGESETLGTAIGSLARHLSAGSGVPIQVTLDESTQRLRPEVEGELLRIAQEAMTNAVRHSGATLIEVQCVVHPPLAEIVIVDDGTGVGSRREDSHGMEIMAERARLAGGDLSVAPRIPHGTSVTARIGVIEGRVDLPGALGPISRRKSAGLGRVLQP